MKEGEYADSGVVRLKKLHYKLLGRFDLEVDAIPIREERVRFAYRELFDGQVQMLLPDHFIRMPEELVRLRYLSAYRPHLILTARDPTENIGLSCIARKERDLHETLVMMRASVQQTAPESVFYESSQITAKNSEGFWFEYKSFTINDEAYNLQFLFGSEKIILLGVFNCCIRYFDEWKPFIVKALEYTEIFDGRVL